MLIENSLQPRRAEELKSFSGWKYCTETWWELFFGFVFWKNTENLRILQFESVHFMMIVNGESLFKLKVSRDLQIQLCPLCKNEFERQDGLCHLCVSVSRVASGTWWHYVESKQGLLGFMDNLGCFHGRQTLHCFVFFFWGKRAFGHWLTSGYWMTTLNMNAGGLTAHLDTVATLWRNLPSFGLWHCSELVFGDSTQSYISDLVTWQMTTLSPTDQ